jgi:putative transposase
MRRPSMPAAELYGPIRAICRRVGRIARRALVAENTVNHCSWRSHNFEFVLNTDEEKLRLRALLKEHKQQHGIVILSYCLMDSHPHLVSMSPRGQRAFSAFWQVVNQRYARWYNRRHGRRGQVVMERLSSPQIQDDRHLLNAIRYGDLNPVKAGIARTAKDWKWSSYRHYAFGEPDDLVDDAPAYLALGKTPRERRLAYRHLFATGLEQFLVRRPDLVSAPFIGDPTWISARLHACRPPAPS